MAANVFGFFLGGYEATASALSYCLHELAFNSHVQDKLRQEIKTIVGSDFSTDNVTLDSIKELKYMGIVISGDFIRLL